MRNKKKVKEGEELIYHAFLADKMTNVELEEFGERQKTQEFKHFFNVFIVLCCFLSLPIYFFICSRTSTDAYQKYVPSYEPFKDDVSIRNTAFDRECYQFVSGSDTDGKDNNSCYSHVPSRNYLSCHLQIAPSEARIPRVLIIGSRGKVGRELVKILAKNKTLFTEVKGSYHINADFGNFGSFLDAANFITMIDLSRPSIPSLRDLAKYRNMKYIKLVDNIENQNSDYVQIKIKEPFGNQYLKIGVSPFFRAIYDCINIDKCQCLLLMKQRNIT